MKRNARTLSNSCSRIAPATRVVVLIAVAACSPEELDICATVKTQTASLELGTAKPGASAGGFDYVAVSEGGMLNLWEGPQGGFHVWGSIRAQGVYPGTEAERLGESEGPSMSPVADYMLVTTATQAVEAMESFQKPLVPSNPWAERLGDFVVLKGPRPKEEFLALEGQAATYSVAVTDTCGTRVEDSRSVVLNVLTVQEQADL